MATATKQKPKTPAAEPLTEFVDNRGKKLTIDREKNTIAGVKILGLESLNGRSYSPAAVKAAISLYEGAKVNVNHPEKGPKQPRRYEDRLGNTRSVHYVEGQGLFGTLHYNPKHPVAEQLLHDAEHAPENVGFSHNADAVYSRKGGKNVVEAITTVRSVDLVADPATCRSLYEHTELEDEGMDLSKMTLEEILSARPDLKAAVLEESKQADEIEAKDQQIKELTEAVDRYKAKEEAEKRRTEITEELTAAKLDPADEKQVSKVFMEQLVSIKDTNARKALIEDRAAIFKGTPAKPGSKPQSKDQVVTEQVDDEPEQIDPKAVANRYRAA